MGFKEIFTVLDKKKNPKQEEIDNIPSYMFTKWLGGHPFTIGAANEINKFYNQIPMALQYSMIKTVFAGKNIYIQFLKNTKNDDKELEVIAKHFKISVEKAKEYKEILSTKEFKGIIDLYKNL